MPHLIVTGGSGYIGSALIRAASVRGWRVTSLERAPTTSADGGVRRVPWQLGDALPHDLIEERGGAAIIHAAHQWDTAGKSDDPNIVGTNILVRSSLELGIGRFVFVSSVSARSDALNIYGRLKWQLEQQVSGLGAVCARVGLVYGGSRRAQYGALARLAGMAVLPMIAAEREVQPIHLTEVCDGLLSLSLKPSLGRSIYVLAAPQSMTFGDFLRTLARGVHGKSLFMLPIPTGMALAATRVSRWIPFVPTVSPERILGLKGMHFVPAADSLLEIGLPVQDMALKLRGEAGLRRRRWIVEARVLLRYVLGETPGPAAMRRYVRALEALPREEPLVLPKAARCWPPLLRVSEPLDPACPLSERLALAVRLAEAMQSKRFFAYRGARLVSLARLLAALVIDLFALPFRLGRR